MFLQYFELTPSTLVTPTIAISQNAQVLLILRILMHKAQEPVNSLIKKQNLCKNDLKNYCPISNLGFLSKVLEEVVANSLNEHIYKHHLSNDLQFANKRFHSTETARLKIHNDIHS